MAFDLKQENSGQLNVFQYAAYYPAPLEMYFLSEKQKEKLSQQRQKLELTRQYAQSIIDNPDLAKNLEKDILTGVIYSPSEAANVYARMKALDGDGARIGLEKSEISPTGQFILLSDFACDKLGIMTDGYLLKNELDPMFEVLNAERVTQKNLDKLVSAASKYGVIIYQRGAYAALKPYLEEAVSVEAVKESFESYKKGQEDSAPGAPSHGASLSSLMSRVSQQAQVTQPAITPTPAKSVVEQQKPKGPQGLPTKEEIKREIQTKELPAPEGVDVKAKPKTPTPPASPKPDTSVPQSALTKNPTSGLPSLKAIDVIDDLKKIEPAHLRQGDLNDQVKAISQKIANLAASNKVLPVKVAQAFEQSPLFKLYLEIGGRMISHSVNNRKPDYRQVVSELTNEGKQVLSFTEFEAVADLRKELEKL
jgi:hypothetical protein